MWTADDRKKGLSWGMPLLFSIQGGNEFLVIFQKRCLWAQASELQGLWRKTEIDRRVSWCDDGRLSSGFWCRGSVSKRLDEDGLVFKRVWRWRELQWGRPVRVFVKSKNVQYCVIIWCSCWRAMKNSHQLALNASLNAITFQRWTLMNTAKPWVNVCWWQAGLKLYQYREHPSRNELFYLETGR